MIHAITNVDTGEKLYFEASTAYEAMTMLSQYLGANITIYKNDSNRFLFTIHNGATYATKL